VKMVRLSNSSGKHVHEYNRDTKKNRSAKSRHKEYGMIAIDRGDGVGASDKSNRKESGGRAVRC